jgi:hypothetical protein
MEGISSNVLPLERTGLSLFCLPFLVTVHKDSSYFSADETLLHTFLTRSSYTLRLRSSATNRKVT